MTDNTMREALLKFGDENPSLDLDFRLHTHGKYLTQEKAIVASRAFKAGAAWQAARTVPEASSSIFASRCPMCSYQHGHQIGCENNPIDIALRTAAPEPKK